MVKWSRWMVLGVAMVLGACATVDKEAVKSQTTGKRLVVASALDHQVNLQWIGTTALNNESQTIEKSEWNLPTAFHQGLQRELEAGGRFTRVTLIHSLGADRQALLAAAGREADVALVLTPGTTVEPLYSTGRTIRGFGVFQRSVFGARLHSLPHVVIKAELVDLKTSQPIAAFTAQTHEIKEYSLDSGATLANDKAQMVRDSLTRQLVTAHSQMLRGFGFE
jgi:hypothetical protein